MIIQGKNHRCLDFNPATKECYVNDCDKNNPHMKWKWGFVNMTAIENWDTYGAKLVD